MQIELHELAALFSGSQKQAATQPKDIGQNIVVLDRGFVVIGRVSEEGDYLVINDCNCIRLWGTTKGLGQLAREGKQHATVLDAQPRTVVHKLQVVQIIDCEDEAWKQ